MPPIEAKVIKYKKAIPLGDNEGIYVQDRITSKMRSVSGSTYMLTQNEELWAKTQSPTLEKLLRSPKNPLADRSVFGSRSQVRGRIESAAEAAFDPIPVLKMKIIETFLIFGLISRRQEKSFENLNSQIWDKSLDVRVIFSVQLLINWFIKKEIL